MRYVTHDAAGNLTGAYLQDLHPAHAAAYLEVTAEVFDNWTAYRIVAGQFVKVTPQPTLEERKAARQAIVDAITVTVSTGKVFDGNEEAQGRMSRAVQVAQVAGIGSTTWVLANNLPTTVTLAELQEALVLSMQAMGAVWAAPYE